MKSFWWLYVSGSRNVFVHLFYSFCPAVIFSVFWLFFFSNFFFRWFPWRSKASLQCRVVAVCYSSFHWGTTIHGQIHWSWQCAASWESAPLSKNQLRADLIQPGVFSTMAALLMMVQWWKEDLCYLKRWMAPVGMQGIMRAAPKCNASYLFTLAHNVKGRWWWYGSRGWTFSPVFHSMLLLCYRWQLRGSLTKWHIKSVYEAKVCHLILPCRRNGTHWHSLMLAESLWRPNTGCEHIWLVGGAFQQWRQQCRRPTIFWTGMHSCHTMQWRAPQSAHPHKSASSGDYVEK